jgi:hypothetical protein
MGDAIAEALPMRCVVGSVDFGLLDDLLLDRLILLSLDFCCLGDLDPGCRPGRRIARNERPAGKRLKRRLFDQPSE